MQVDDAHRKKMIAPAAEPTISRFGRRQKRAKLADGGAGGTDENTGARAWLHADMKPTDYSLTLQYPPPSFRTFLDSAVLRAFQVWIKSTEDVKISIRCNQCEG